MYNEFNKNCEQLGIKISKEQLSLVEKYVNNLIETNAKFNLTSITDVKDILSKHFLDSFSLYELLKNYPDCSLLDVGTGGGFPGLALSILFPDMHIGLLEATTKKTVFLKETADLLERQHVEVINGRCEDFAQKPQYREVYDVVTARALARMATLLEYTLPFTKVGGRVITMKKGNLDEEISEAQKASHLLGGELEDKIKIILPGLEDDPRYLIIYKKKTKTNAKYPRRNGIPSKLPLL